MSFVTSHERVNTHSLFAKKEADRTHFCSSSVLDKNVSILRAVVSFVPVCLFLFQHFRSTNNEATDQCETVDRYSFTSVKRL